MSQPIRSERVGSLVKKTPRRENDRATDGRRALNRQEKERVMGCNVVVVVKGRVAALWAGVSLVWELARPLDWGPFRGQTGLFSHSEWPSLRSHGLPTYLTSGRAIEVGSAQKKLNGAIKN